MEKIITIDIQKEEDLVEVYNDEVINNNLIDYIFKKTLYTKKEDNIKFIISNKCNTKLPIKDIIIKGLKLEHEHLTKEFERNNFIQILLLLMGLTFLFLSTFINEESIWKEFLVIAGWVPIWEMIDIALFKDIKNRRKKKIIERLVNSDFEIEI